MENFNFKIEKKLDGRLGRAGFIETSHGIIQTPCFVCVGTKATVKSLTPEQIKELGAQTVLSNTYHLYLQPGTDILEKAGGLHNFSGWSEPMFTDSGGFQVFSLGKAFGKGVSKIAKGEASLVDESKEDIEPIAKITEDGVSFKSHIDGSEHFFTPEKSIQIQHSIGADIIFAFDEATAPTETKQYQKEAMDRTHRWAKRSLDEHKRLGGPQALFGIVQGGQFEDLRKESAEIIGSMNFDGFGIGGSYTKDNISQVVALVNNILPEEKPKHLLGIGEPEDLFLGVEAGCDTFDCVAPTRSARNGSLYTKEGKINILNSKFREDMTPIEKDCGCYTCKNFTKGYLSHLFRAKEILSNTLATIHNLYFIISLVKNIRDSILNDNFDQYKKDFLSTYLKNR